MNENNPKPATFVLDPEGELKTVRRLRAYLDNRDDSSPALFPRQKSDRLTGKALNDVVKKAAKHASVRSHKYTGRALLLTGQPKRYGTVWPTDYCTNTTTTRCTMFATGSGTLQY